MFYDDIHATTVREALDCLNDILFVVVNHLICTNRARPLELLLRPRRGEDPRAVQTRDLNRRLTDAASRRQHQHVVAVLEARARQEHVPRREKRQRKRRRLREVDVSGIFTRFCNGTVTSSA